MFITIFDGKPVVSDTRPIILEPYTSQLEVSLNTLLEAAKVAYRAGNKIVAIKLMRAVFPGLKEAKEFVENYLGEEKSSPCDDDW